MHFGKPFVRDAYAALCNAALKVAEKARAENRELPFLVDGEIVHQVPTLTAADVEKLLESCDQRLEAEDASDDGSRNESGSSG